MKKALIMGITGQDSAYLAEFLLDKGSEVDGIKRRALSFNAQRIDHLFRYLLIGDVTKARTVLGWQPKYGLEAIVKEIIASGLQYLKKK